MVLPPHPPSSRHSPRLQQVSPPPLLHLRFLSVKQVWLVPQHTFFVSPWVLLVFSFQLLLLVFPSRQLFWGGCLPSLDPIKASLAEAFPYGCEECYSALQAIYRSDFYLHMEVQLQVLSLAWDLSPFRTLVWLAECCEPFLPCNASSYQAPQ